MRIQSQRETFAWRLASVDPLMVPTEHLDPHKTYDWTDSVQKNPRLLKDIQRRGIQQPAIMETDGKLGILSDGNHRLAAAKMLGIPQMPVVFNAQPSRYLQRGGGVPLHPSIQKHLAEHPEALQDAESIDRQSSWTQGEH